MENSIETINYRGYKINIFSDDDPLDPREWDNLGTMVCFHSRYNLGDKHDFSDPDEFLEWVKDIGLDKIIILPLYLYDHSGITMSTGSFSCPWDSGQVGWIYIEKSKVRKEYNWKKLTQARIEKIKTYLTEEVKEYDNYITGSVYGFKIDGPDLKGQLDEDIDSCWGFFGYDHEASGLLDHARPEIDYHIAEQQKNRDQAHKSQFAALKARIKAGVDLIYRPTFNEYIINHE